MIAVFAALVILTFGLPLEGTSERDGISSIERFHNDKGEVQYIIRPCTDQMIRNTTDLIGDWEGQATLWASQPD